jgi:RHS repeat-associated protein
MIAVNSAREFSRADRSKPIRARSIASLVVLIGLVWSAAAAAQQQSWVVNSGMIPSGNGARWSGLAATFEEAAAATLALDHDCWSDGHGGCLPLSLGSCSPSGAPSASVTSSSCKFVSYEYPGWWGVIYVDAGQTTAAYWTQSPSPSRADVCSICVGDPINPGAGTVYKRESDVVFAGQTTPLRFQRLYNSGDAAGVDMGPGWRHSYDQSIIVNNQPSVPALYPGQSATVSPTYGDPGTACVSGFAAIQSQVNGWQNATASYKNNICVIATAAGTVSALPIYSAPVPTPADNPVEYDVVREDGQILRYTTQNGVINNPPGISLALAQTASGFTLTDDNDTVETYNAAGVLQSVRSRAGVTQTLTYNSQGLLSGVTDSFGNSLSLNRNTNNQLASVTVNGGGTVQYGYDGDLRLSTVTNSDNTTRTYVYDNTTGTLNYLTGIKDETGTLYSSWGYDGYGRATSSSEAGGADSTTATYNNDGSVAVTDALGAVRTFSYTRIGDINRVSGISGSQCPTCQESASTTYDSAGWVASRTDYNGNLTCYANDPVRGLELVRVEGFASGSTCPANLSSYTPQPGTTQRKITTQWSSNWREPSLIVEPTRTTSFTFDGSGNILTRTVTDTTVNPNVSRTWTYTYDSYGRKLTAQDPRTDVNSTTTDTYYTCTSGSQCGQLQTVTDPVGNVTTYNTYSAYGLPLTITDPNGIVTTLTYDARQRLTSRQVGTETTAFSYYPTGLLKQVTLPDSSYALYTYDNAHRLTKVSDGAGNSIQYTLDAMGNRTAEKTYDPSNVLHRTHTRAYNALNELYQDIDAANTSAVTTTYAYDSNGNQTAVDAPLSRNTANSYDALNRLSQLTDPNNGNTYFAYDAENDLTSVKDPLGLTTSYGYNGFGDLTGQSSPDTGSTVNTYDSGGNLSTSTDARGAVATYSYDAANRVASIAYSLSGSTDETLTFGYDSGTNGKGRLTSASDANHSLSWTYDGLGRVTGKGLTVGTVNLSVGYGYANGDLTALVTPSGQSVTYGFNSNHQVTSIAVNGTRVVSGVTYEPFGGVNGWTWGDASTTSRTFNGDGLINQIVTAGVTLGYSFDNANRITGIADSSNSALTWSYGYDLLDRLTSATTSAITDGWTYDSNGNMLTQTGSTPETFSVNSSSNQLSSTSGSFARTYSYDAAGHAASYGSLGFTYNDRGRMEATSADSTDYLYNALGQMIEKSGTLGTTIFMQDEAGHLIGEYDGSGKLIEETVWLGNIPVATLRPHSGGGIDIYYVHTDHLNAPRKIAQPTTGTLAWRWDADPFGTTAPNQNPAGLGTFLYNLRFPGHYYMAETGLNYNWNRDYDPLTGKYIESDLLGLRGGSYATYGYAGSNPLTYVDALGLCWQFSQSTGQWSYVDDLTGVATPVGLGWSGQGEGYNKPSMEWEEDRGPLPAGIYRIESAEPWHGMPDVMLLTPEWAFQFGRPGPFLIHGANKDPAKAAKSSQGCPIATAKTRRRIAKSNDHCLWVVH